MKRFVLLSLVTAAILAAGSPGIRPRADVAEYPSNESLEAAAIGVAVIPPGEVKKIFAADLSGAGYVVIEVGVFPKAGREVDLSPLDFTLLADPNSISERPTDSGVIAAAAGKQQRPHSETDSSEVSIDAGASIQHESYPDPVTGRRVGTTIAASTQAWGLASPVTDNAFRCLLRPPPRVAINWSSNSGKSPCPTEKPRWPSRDICTSRSLRRNRQKALGCSIGTTPREQ